LKVHVLEILGESISFPEITPFFGKEQWVVQFYRKPSKAFDQISVKSVDPDEKLTVQIKQSARD
jgi:hypothetical protein